MRRVIVIELVVSIKGEGRGGKSNWDIVWIYAIFFFDGVPNMKIEILIDVSNHNFVI